MGAHQPSQEIIDSHHHLWHYSPAEYNWIDDKMTALRRDFLLEDLVIELAASGIDGAVTVQARQTLEETQWLLQLARNSPAIRGVVGWAPITSPELEASLDTLAPHPKLVGLRHVVQAEPKGFLDRPDFNRGIDLLQKSHLGDYRIDDRLWQCHRIERSADTLDTNTIGGCNADSGSGGDKGNTEQPGSLGLFATGLFGGATVLRRRLAA